MPRRNKWVISLIAITLGVSNIPYFIGARINTTHSIPVGLYWTSAAPISNGDYVMFCPPPSKLFDDAKQRGYIRAGRCPGGYGPLMKRIIARESDYVGFSEVGLVVNGKLLEMSGPMATDDQGATLPVYRRAYTALKPGEAVVMGQLNPESFDSRYFGPIRLSHIESVIRPVLIKK